MLARLTAGIGAALVLIYAALLIVPIDPYERRPGTRLGGDPAAVQTPDWTGYGRKQIAVQTRTWYLVPHSVTTTSWVDDDGSLYVPCARCDGKRWPANVARDNRVRLKIDGLLYDRIAVRIADPEERARVLGAVGRDAIDGMAAFRMEPRY